MNQTNASDVNFFKIYKQEHKNIHPSFNKSKNKYQVY